MDIDRFLAQHAPTWDRLSELSTKGTRAGRLSAAEIDELIALYQRTGTHLAEARVASREPALHQRLTTVLAEAHAVIHGTRPGPEGRSGGS
jgi:hypothetical protein